MRGDKAKVGFALVALLLAAGSVWAFQRGGRDFDVFQHAWRLVLSGQGREVYSSSPDRFLYAPGFAWLLCPLGYFPRWLGLGLWCLAQAAVMAWLVWIAASRLPSTLSWAAAAGLAIVARPFLIDLGYGQVNTFILGAAIWALLEHAGVARRESTVLAFLSWAVLACAAVAKIFPLPLLLIPFFDSGVPRSRLKIERAGAVAGALAVLLFPMLTEGFMGWVTLMQGWRDALLAKGLPLESHNQSFVAFLYHYFSGIPTHVISEGPPKVLLGFPLFAAQTIELLSLAWTFSWAGFLFAWILLGPREDRFRWIAVALAMLVLPSHLFWKTYLIFCFPLAAWIASREGVSAFTLALFAAINLTGYELIGHALSSRIEAGSVLLFANLVMVSYGVVTSNSASSSPRVRRGRAGTS